MCTIALLFYNAQPLGEGNYFCAGHFRTSVVVDDKSFHLSAWKEFGCDSSMLCV